MSTHKSAKQTIQSRDVTLRIVPQPSDLNVNGNIFGGWVLSQMDIAGAVIASRRAKGPVATVAIKSMKFHQPINVGDVVSVYTHIVETGRTSITVGIEVYSGKREDNAEEQVTEGCFVFVALDKAGRPRAID